MLTRITLGVLILVSSIAQAASPFLNHFMDIRQGSVRPLRQAADLNLSGAGLRAWNLGNDQTVVLSGIGFLGNEVGLTKSGEWAKFDKAPNTSRPKLGSSKDDVALSSLLGTGLLKYGGQIQLDAKKGQTYRLQLLFHEPYWTWNQYMVGRQLGGIPYSSNRRFDVFIDGKPAALNLDILRIANGYGQTGKLMTMGVIYETVLTASKSSIELDLRPSLNARDGNCVISGIILTETGAKELAANPNANKRDAVRMAAWPKVKVVIISPIKTVAMGKSITVNATATLSDGKPAAGFLLMPHVNGARWGAHELSNAQGKATFHLPLPNPGQANIQIRVNEPSSSTQDQWLWGPDPNEPGVRYLQKQFELKVLPQSAQIWVAVDDVCTVYINGQKLGDRALFFGVTPLEVPVSMLKPGNNTFSIKADNGGGLGGVKARLHMVLPDKSILAIITDTSWGMSTTLPAGWPDAVSVVSEGKPTAHLQEATLYSPKGYPGLEGHWQFYSGSPMPSFGPKSNVLAVTVNTRTITPLPKDNKIHLVNQWAPWFTHLNANWSTSYAVPVMGLYWSADRSVIRQQVLWMLDAGIDVISVDWSNNIAGATSFSPGIGVAHLIESTDSLFGTLAQMRNEGIPVPTVTILTGSSRLDDPGIDAINQQMDFIYTHYVQPDKYKGLFFEIDGKPVIHQLDVFAGYYKQKLTEKIDPQRRFSFRYEGVGNEKVNWHLDGFWSWMDAEPRVSIWNGKPEAVTLSVGAFSRDSGWLQDKTHRRNGATLMEHARAIIDSPPPVIQLHQWNEFAGAMENQGFGPEGTVYLDSYNVEYSDDIEPTSLTTPAYRSVGGYGYYQLNLTTAIIDMIRNPKVRDAYTTVIIHNPVLRDVITADTCIIEWQSLGKSANSYSLFINGQLTASKITGNKYQLNLKKLREGQLTVRIVANGTKTRVPLSYTESFTPANLNEPASMTIFCELRR